MQLKIYHRVFLFLVTVAWTLTLNQFCWANDEAMPAPYPAQHFKVIGYYSGDLFDEPLERLQTDKLTHVVYAFLIPRSDGNLVALEKPRQLKDLVAKAHQDGTKVYIALGGYSYQGVPLVSTFEALAADPETRKRLVENVGRLLDEYDLDGMELNWEHPTPQTIGDYEQLVKEFRQVLNQEGKDFNAVMYGAWSPFQGPEISQLMTAEILDCFDSINTMGYDLSEDDHSPLWFAETSVDYWLNRDIPAHKVILGVPLYARPSWLQYRHLVEQNPEYAFQDYAPTTPLDSYYNGINTLREKTMIALRKAGGIMLFDINEDSDDATSILSMVDEFLVRTRHMTAEELNKYVMLVVENRELVFTDEDGLGMPFIDDHNCTMVPLRKTMETIGAQVDFDPAARIVSIEKGSIRVQVPIGKNAITINGQTTVIDTQAVILADRTYMPLRAVLEAFGYELEWHQSSSTIYIQEKGNGSLVLD